MSTKKRKTARRNFATPAEALAYRVRQDGECIVWTGKTIRNRSGQLYGQLASGGVYLMVHRLAWELEHGEIPAGLVVDHYRCGNTLCVNVQHMRLATQSQNNLNRHVTHNQHGYRGVHRTKSGTYWAEVSFEGERHYLGTFTTPEAAGLAAARKRRQLDPGIFDDTEDRIRRGFFDHVAVSVQQDPSAFPLLVAEEISTLYPWAEPFDVVEALQALDHALTV